MLKASDRALIALLRPVGRTLVSSLRVQLHDGHHVTRLRDAGQPFIFLVWHAQLLLAVPTAARFAIVTLASPTRDGQIGAAIAQAVGIKTVTGDSRYRSLGALRQLAAELGAGHSLGLFPDGPSGPARRMKVGPLVLAKHTGCPLVPAAGTANWRLALRGHWDQFLLPLPFARIQAVIGEPLWIPPTSDAAALEQQARTLEQRLAALQARADTLCAKAPARHPGPQG